MICHKKEGQSEGECILCKKHEDCGNVKTLICKDSKCIYCLRNGEKCSNERECCDCPNCKCVSGICTKLKKCTVDGDCGAEKVCDPYRDNFHACYSSCAEGGTLVCNTNEDVVMKKFCKNGRCLECLKLGSDCVDGDLCCYGESCQNGKCLTIPSKEPVI